jgi:hypothetical protein
MNTRGGFMKRTWISFVVVVGLVLSQTSFASADYNQHLQVIDPPKIFLKKLNRESELIIDHVSSSGYEVYGPSGLPSFLTKLGVHFSPIERASNRLLAEYPSAEATVQKMQDLQKKFPNLIRLVEIGKSVEGRSLVFAKLSAPNQAGNQIVDRPEFKYIANMHGDEIVGRELMIRLIEDLVTQFGKDDRITKLMNSVQIYIMPSMNPDGATHQVRFNAHGVDLNRSFPDFTTSDNVNTSANREPEIQAMMKFQAQHKFKLSANFHGGSEVVNYPWDTTAERHPLDNFVQQLSLDYSKRVPYIYNSRQFKYGITNGSDWYEVDGGMQDWSYYWHRDLQVTIELTSTKWPSYSTVAGTYASNRDALIAYIEDIFQVQ